MPEDQDTVFCEDVIYSEDYRDYIKGFFQYHPYISTGVY